MSIDFKTFLSIIPHVVDARYPILTRGRHGIGKSTLVYQLAKQMDLEVVERRASQMTEGEIPSSIVRPKDFNASAPGKLVVPWAISS